MGELIIIRGVSGSGKSTLSKILCNALPARHYEADMYFMSYDGKEYNFEPSKLQLAHVWCQRKVEKEMQEGFSVIVSNTFTTEQELQPYLDLAEKYNYKVTSLVVENRHGNNDIHNVPDEIKQRQASRLQQNIKLI